MTHPELAADDCAKGVSTLRREQSATVEALTISGLSVLASLTAELVVAGNLGLRELTLLALVAFAPSLLLAIAVLCVERIVGEHIRRRGPEIATLLVAGTVALAFAIGGVVLSNVLLVDFPTDRRTLAGCTASCVLGALLFVAGRRAARSPRVQSAAQRWWREALLATTLLVALGLATGNARCLVYAFPWAHFGAILGSIFAFVCASYIVCRTQLLALDVRIKLRALGALSLLLIAGGVQTATHRLAIDAFMRVPSAGRTLLTRIRGAFDRDGDGYTAWLAGGDCDDQDARSFPLSTIGRDCLDLVPPAGPETANRAESKPAYSATPVNGAPQHLVFVTIDAFRCALGARERAELSSDVCPQLDALRRKGSAEGRVHARAPHTIGSLAAIMAFDGDGDLDTLPSALRRRGYRTETVATHRSLLRDPRMRASFDHPDDSLAPIAEEAGSTSSDEVTSRVLAKIEAATQAERNTFVWAHYYDAHAPYVRDPGSRIAYDHLESYQEEIKRTDRAIGRLISSLDARFANGEVALFITADHGEEFEEHGGTTHGRALYEEVTNVPFIAWRTGSNPRHGLPSELPTGGVDIAPYVMSVVTGAPFSPSDSVLMEASPFDDRQVGVVHGRTKYILHYQLGYEELFDLERDPLEHDDLSGQDPVRLTTMRQLLGEHLRREHEHRRTL
jgi:Sulfatase